MPRVSVDHLQARRRQILDGARAAFARHGYEGATVRILEQEIGLSRGAIFHHYADKDALFLALAVQDADTIVHTVAEHGLVQVMREMIGAPDAGRLGVQLEVARRVRTTPTSGLPGRRTPRGFTRRRWIGWIGNGPPGHCAPTSTSSSWPVTWNWSGKD